jgi:hypothetical protein
VFKKACHLFKPSSEINDCHLLPLPARHRKTNAKQHPVRLVCSARLMNINSNVVRFQGGGGGADAGMGTGTVVLCKQLYSHREAFAQQGWRDQSVLSSRDEPGGGREASRYRIPAELRSGTANPPAKRFPHRTLFSTPADSAKWLDLF